MSYFGLTFGEYPGSWWGTALTPPVPVVLLPTGGGIRLKRKPRQRDWEQERRDAAALRRFLERLLDPVQENADVVTSDDVVAVLPEKGQKIALAVPAKFSAAQVAQEVMSVLRARALQVEHVRTVQARRQAAEVMEAARHENARRLLKRRRDEEILLLM